jgi:hypothetical protein
MAYTDPTIPTVNIEEQDPITGLISEGTVKGTPPVVAGKFALECELTDIDGSGTYSNTGTVAIPSWTLFGTLAALASAKIFVGNAANVATAVALSGDATIDNTGKMTIADDAITAVKLAAAITPSHVIKYAGTATGGTTATRAYTITGAAATDVVTAVIRASTTATTIQKVTLSANTMTVLFTADPGVSTTVDYQICRAIA